MLLNDTKIDQKIKNKSLLKIEKNIIKSKKRLIIIVKNFFFFKKKSNYSKKFFDEKQIKTKYQDVFKNQF